MPWLPPSLGWSGDGEGTTAPSRLLAVPRSHPCPGVFLGQRELEHPHPRRTVGVSIRQHPAPRAGFPRRLEASAGTVLVWGQGLGRRGGDRTGRGLPGSISCCLRQLLERGQRSQPRAAGDAARISPELCHPVHPPAIPCTPPPPRRGFALRLAAEAKAPRQGWHF